MNSKTLSILTVLFFLTVGIKAQNTADQDYKYFIGSSFFMLGNFLEESPKYYQLNFGYRITPKSVVIVEAITWAYQGPLGRQYGPHYENPESNYPGSVQAFGVGVSFKQFLTQRLYTQLHSTALRQNYLDLEGEKIQSGFQLFNALRLGYQFRFFKNRFFLEPSVAITFFPINTNLPESFQVQDDRFANYFLGEPGLHFGFNF